ncbi:MAG: hypothetical protein QG608_101 [Actinomycetota bacterium]|nr:hypothetical protein [Actinomycetota bacterium]
MMADSRDLLMDEELVERFLDGHTTREEDEALAHAMVRFFPHPQGSSPEEFPEYVAERVGYILTELDDRELVNKWLFQVPGLPRFVAAMSQLEVMLEGLDPDHWLVAELDRIPVPEDLDHVWLKNDRRGGATHLGMCIGTQLVQRHFAETGWLAERALGILRRASATEGENPEDRRNHATMFTAALHNLHEDAALTGIAFREPYQG